MPHPQSVCNMPTVSKSAPRLMNGENVAPEIERLPGHGEKVYAVLFSDGWIKVGRGRNASSRIKSHAGVSGMRGAHVLRTQVSGPLSNPKAAERRLIAFCAATGQLAHGKEWFTCVDFEVLSQIIRDEFPGDSLMSRAELAEKSKIAADRLIDAIDAHFGVVPAVAEQDHKWTASLTHASVINQIYLDDLYDGDLFKVSPWGMTSFETLAALAIYSMGFREIAKTYQFVLSRPGDALETLVAAGESAVAEFASLEASA